jgi:hypothetical protein
MSELPSIDMPEDFPERIHQALRAWHSRHRTGKLDGLLLSHHMRTQAGASSHLVANEILLEGLERLKQVDSAAADLLEQRFLDRETLVSVSHKRNLSEDSVYRHQRAAIAQLAQAIWAEEVMLLQRRMQRVEARLEPRTYTRLFGVMEKMTEVRSKLEADSEPWVIALEGIGGIGKTSMADALARELARTPHFHEIGWISARQRLFRLSGDVEVLDEQPDLTLSELSDRLIDQFDLKPLRRQSDAERLAGLKEFLSSQPCLVIIDNLETVTDHHALVSWLQDLIIPSKFLITTRHSLRDQSGVYIATLTELPREDALAMIRHEAETRGLHELANSPKTELKLIYDASGGNPLAIKLIVGQVHTLSLTTAIDRLERAKGKPTEELLTFIYDDAWRSLDQDCRHVLQAMLLVSQEGGRLEQIDAVAGLDRDATASCLHRLVTLSLVNVGGSPHERLYSIHQLTRSFVAHQSVENDTGDLRLAGPSEVAG